MTVAELIEKLRAMPQDALVLCEPLRDPYERFYPRTVEADSGKVTISTNLMPGEECDRCHSALTQCEPCAWGYCKLCGEQDACPHLLTPR